MTYLPIPVSAAHDIAEQFAKGVVIIIAWDVESQRLHTTTYGASEQERAWAADGGEIAAKALGALPEQAMFYENYRKHCCVGAGHVSVINDGRPVELQCAAHPEA